MKTHDTTLNNIFSVYSVPIWQLVQVKSTELAQLEDVLLRFLFSSR